MCQENLEREREREGIPSPSLSKRQKASWNSAICSSVRTSPIIDFYIWIWSKTKLCSLHFKHTSKLARTHWEYFEVPIAWPHKHTYREKESTWNKGMTCTKLLKESPSRLVKLNCPFITLEFENDMDSQRSYFFRQTWISWKFARANFLIFVQNGNVRGRVLKMVLNFFQI